MTPVQSRSRLHLLTIRVAALAAVAAAGTLSPAAAQTTSPPASLQVRAGWRIRVAADGMQRIRFGDMSPDGRFFVPDMIDLSDNSKGRIWVLSGFNETTGRFAKRTEYLSGLRNPNDVTFWTDPASGQTWLYVAMTQALVRYRYEAGDTAPQGKAETVAQFPDRGLSYKYGGWHLTRTVVITKGADPTLYVSVGSSCNVCEEKTSEPSRAAIVAMKPDGSALHVVAKGLRNAVGMELVNNQVYVTNMGSDHLGKDKPEETLYRVTEGSNYGWPYCYQYQGKVISDPKLGATSRRIDCAIVPKATATFLAHSAPLGLRYFDESLSPEIAGSFLVALHGSGDKSYRRGYSVVQVKDGKVTDFITGFQGPKTTVYGRPVDILPFGKNRFLLTDDKAGIVFLVDHP